jgi:hypothetical protein
LQASRYPVTNYDNADRQDYDTSLVIHNRAKPATALQKFSPCWSCLSLPSSTAPTPPAQYDVVIILGAD